MTKPEAWKWVRAVLLLLCVATATASAGKITVKALVTFNGTNGAEPYDGLVQGIDGSLYGTTAYGGPYDYCDQVHFNHCGTAFKITPAGKLTTLFNFCPRSGCADGYFPYAGLVQAADGNFYGTTMGGNTGTTVESGVSQDGTVFKITAHGKVTTLHRFDLADGGFPAATLVQAIDGNFYGTTVYGGAYLWGTVFKITPAGKLTTLYSFCSQTNCPDGSLVYGGLIQTADGNFYGTTDGGGAYGQGTVFKITPAGKLTTLYSFCSLINCPDGREPQAGLVQGADGNFYGTTISGPSDGCDCGTVFRITPKGKLTTLYRFTGYPDGASPKASLVEGTDGSFYGTTIDGGSGGPCPYIYEGGCGTVFKITRAGRLTTLYSFCPGGDCANGYSPIGRLVQATDGNFYGTTFTDPDFLSGTVFRLSVGLGPFVGTRPTSGRVGDQIIILGTNLTGATSVTFHGTPATYTVVSKSEITATVPTGATTGKVEVKTPRKALKSNVNFRVTP